MKCNHTKVKEDAKPTQNGSGYDFWDAYICPDCYRPIIVRSNWTHNPKDCKPSFRIANFSMAGVGDYWKELQMDGSFKARN